MVGNICPINNWVLFSHGISLERKGILPLTQARLKNTVTWDCESLYEQQPGERTDAYLAKDRIRQLPLCILDSRCGVCLDVSLSLKRCCKAQRRESVLLRCGSWMRRPGDCHPLGVPMLLCSIDPRTGSLYTPWFVSDDGRWCPELKRCEAQLAILA